METFLEKTAWPMAVPEPGSAFHLLFVLFGLAAALWLSRRAAAFCRKNEKAPFRFLLLCGLILAAGELYKQLFLYEIVNGGRYNWWYFPFQLCSTPMYLCLLLPLFQRRRRAAGLLFTYLQDFSLLGGVMALAEPSGLFHPYWTLTLHGLLWHILLVFLGLTIFRAGLADPGVRGYARTLPLLFLFCLIATAINVATGGQADMFYISPYYPVTQVVFHRLSLLFGTPAGIALYLLALCLGGLLTHLGLERISQLCKRRN